MKQNVVYLITNPMQITEAQYISLFNNLPASRQAKARSFRFYKDQVLSVLAASLLNYALKDSTGYTQAPEIIQEGNEKPVIRSHPEIGFNLSHCEAAIACAISDKPVGVDVQEARDGIRKIAKRYFTERENAIITSTANEAMQQILYRRVWTLKEAYGKYTGKGLMYKLQGRDFSALLTENPAMIPCRCTYEDKQVLLMDEQTWSMAVISERPMTIQGCTIADLCEMADGSGRTML